MVVLGWWLGLMILKVFSNLNDSMILWFRIRNTNDWLESIVTVGVFLTRFSDKEAHDISPTKGLKLINIKRKNG